MRPKGEATLAKAARLSVLLALSDEGLIEGRTLQSLADAFGDNLNRSTVMKDLRDLPTVRRERDRLMKRMRSQLKQTD